MAMHFDAHEAETFNSLLNQAQHPAPVIHGMDKGKAVETVRTAGDNTSHLTIGRSVVRVESGKEHSFVNASMRRPSHVASQRRGGVPWAGQPIPFTGVTVAVNDHSKTPELTLAIVVDRGSA